MDQDMASSLEQFSQGSALAESTGRKGQKGRKGFFFLLLLLFCFFEFLKDFSKMIVIEFE